MPASDTNIPIPVSKLEQALQDPQQASRIAHLTYVNDGEEGIKRIKKGKQFSYTLKGKAVKDTQQLARIKSLVIPPAWKEVWICSKANGHLQCTGIDALGRKQYRYHPLWNKLRKQTKFYQLLQFGKALRGLRKKLAYHLSKKELSREKVLAAIVSVMDKTGIRVGSSMYEKLYGSYGLSTLQNKHLQIKGNELIFKFKGKKGVYQDISLKSARLARIIRQCKEIPGKELFQYRDDSGEAHSIHSGDVNDFIRELSGGSFSSKDFRTWLGTTECLREFAQTGEYETQTEMKKNVVTVLDQVAATLGNTRTVCKNHYVHPAIITLYETKKLMPYLKNLSGNSNEKEVESTLLRILKKETAK